MNDTSWLHNLLNNISNYALALLVGFLGGMLGIGSGNVRLKGHGITRGISWLVAVGSSMLFCVATYALIVHKFANAELGIALGGAVAWLGADWVKKKIDKFIDTLISMVAKKSVDGVSNNERYDNEDLEDIPRPPKEY
ncbi:hypothetical protein [Campylobacter sp. FOBRC14]|jgi:hypothetical protein|uniref:hypothetical protein n=1 Tax=Campylobacter sp. FOBRC14 TaxID=936554 RepID=UPI00027A3660|nr:hypothetical protein [Campylobacter sp. FOBRC14]EJP75929.1 hypothetical protein HMPREF1139_2032 [Campylobacter sp. FOBRC14]